jgi:hypothetical protein
MYQPGSISPSECVVVKTGCLRLPAKGLWCGARPPFKCPVERARFRVAEDVGDRSDPDSTFLEVAKAEIVAQVVKDFWQRSCFPLQAFAARCVRSCGRWGATAEMVHRPWGRSLVRAARRSSITLSLTRWCWQIATRSKAVVDVDCARTGGHPEDGGLMGQAAVAQEAFASNFESWR